MSKRTEAANDIKNHLSSLPGSSATKKEMMEQLGMDYCTFDRAMKTLRSRNRVEVAGKKGRENLYKIK